MVREESIERRRLKAIVKAVMDQTNYSSFLPIINREIDRRDDYTIQQVIKNIKIALKL